MSRYPSDAKDPPPGSRTVADPHQTTLERDFQRILAAIQSMWGYPELNTYFYKLTMNDRGQRAGFPADVWDDIHLLWSVHQILVPQTSTQFIP